MSLFSKLGVFLLVGVLLVGTTAKLLISKYRKKLDGFHGYIKHKTETDTEMLDSLESSGWEDL